VQLLPAGFLFHAYSAYVAVMQPEFGWSTATFAAAFSIQQVASGLVGPAQGWLIARFGPTRMIRVGLIVLALGLFLFSRVTGQAAFVATLLLASVGAGLGGFLSTNTVAVNWFARRMSMALAMIQVGISGGGLLVPLVVWSLAQNGWRLTAVASAVLVLLIGLPLTRLIHDRPEDRGLVPDGALQSASAQALEGPDFSAAEAMRTRAFWFLGLGHAMALAVVGAVTAHLVVYLNRELLLSLPLAGLLVTMLSLTTIVGQLAGGVLSDRFDKRALAVLAMFGHATALLMLAYGATLPWVIAFTVVQGLSWGVRGPVMQALRATFFGRRSFSKVMGFSAPLVTVGMFIGPIIVGVMADRLGSFKPGFTVIAALAVLGSLFFVLAKVPTKRPVDGTSR
jgi:MFS family permease